MVFKKGYTPWNKGTHLLFGGKPFEKGHKINLGRVSHRKGKHIWTKEQKLEIGRKQKGKHHYTKTEFNGSYKGEKHWNWKGGLTPIIEQIRKSVRYEKWRNQIYKRDNWTCQDCGKNKCPVEAHHKKELTKILRENNIKTFEEAMNCDIIWDLGNGVTLCVDCHKKTRKRSIIQKI